MCSLPLSKEARSPLPASLRLTARGGSPCRPVCRLAGTETAGLFTGTRKGSRQQGVPTRPPESGRVRPSLVDDKDNKDVHPITPCYVACDTSLTPACMIYLRWSPRTQRNRKLSYARRRLDLQATGPRSDHARSRGLRGSSRRRICSPRVRVRSGASMPRRLTLRARCCPATPVPDLQ